MPASKNAPAVTRHLGDVSVIADCEYLSKMPCVWLMFAGGALTDVYNPFAVDRLAHQLHPPQRSRDVRTVGDDAAEHFAAYLGYLEPRNGTDRMVHSVENEEVEVAKVPRNGKVYNLPPTIIQRPVVAGPSIQNDINVWRRIAFRYQVNPGPDCARCLTTNGG